MGTGESREYQRACIGCALIDVHPGAFFVGFHDGGHIGKIEIRFHAVGEHIHGQRNNIHIAGAFAVSEQGALHPVGAGKQRQLRIGYARAPVIVGMQGEGHILPVFEVFTHVLHLTGVDMGKAHFHGDRQVDDDIVVRAGLQHIQNRVANLQRVFRFRAGEAFGRILKAEIALIFRRQLLDQLGALHGDLLDFFPGLSENLLPLGHGNGIVEVNDGAGCALAGIKGFADDVLPALGQHLHRHILGNHVVFDQGSQELVFRFGGGREADLDFLKTNFQQ